MEQILYNTSSYCIELMKLFVTVVLFFGIKVKSKRQTTLYILLGVAVVAVISIFVNLDKYGFSFGILEIVNIFFCLKDKKQIGSVAVAYIFISLLDMVTGVVASLFRIISYNNTKDFSIIELSLDCVSGIIIAALSFVRIKIIKKSVSLKFSIKQIIMIIIGGCSIGIYLTSVMLFMMDKEYRSYKDIAAIVLSISSIVFIMICFWLMSSQNKNDHLKRENEITQQLLRSQEKYYTMLLKKEEETKRFRHDIRNHLYCMKTLYDNNDFQQLGDYFEKMNIELKELNTGIHTGNNLIDVILNDISSKYTEVKIEWKGLLEPNLRIAQMDLCIVFSNLLSNAFEAADNCENKKVDVYIKKLSSNLLINIANTALNEPVIKDNEFVSSKKENGHGYGVKNIKECLKKYSGCMDCRYENGMFITDLVINNVIEIL